MDLEPSVIDEMRTGMYRYVSVSCVFFLNQLLERSQLFTGIFLHVVQRKLKIRRSLGKIRSSCYFLRVTKFVFDRSAFPSTVFEEYVYLPTSSKLTNIKHFQFFSSILPQKVSET